MKFIDVTLAVAFAIQSWVVAFRFINLNPGVFKVGKPCLDIPCRTEDRDTILCFPWGNFLVPTNLLKFPDSTLRSHTITILDDDQELRDLTSPVTESL